MRWGLFGRLIAASLWLSVWIVLAPASSAIRLQGDTQAIDPPMRFEVVRRTDNACEPNCPEWIAAEGRIVDGSAKNLAALLANKANRNLPFIINSGGGSINNAMRMGRLLRKYQMVTAIGQTIVFDCTEADRLAGKCKPDPALHAFKGMAYPARSYCASACPLVLLGGTARYVDAYSFIGLHEPIAQSQPYVDHFLIHYEMVNGKKHILSKEFVKRTFLTKKTVVGVSSVRGSLSAYLKEMGGSPDIIDEMEKATPKDMYWIPWNTGERQRLGLVTATESPGSNVLDLLVSPQHCEKGETLPANCIYVKEQTQTAMAAPPAKLPTVSPQMIQADPIQPMTFTIMRQSVKTCEPDCPQWIEFDGQITLDAGKKLEQLLAANPDYRKLPLVLSSWDGSLDAALQMGRILRRYGMTVAVGETAFTECGFDARQAGTCGPDPNSKAYRGWVVPNSTCASSCIFVMLGGTVRIADTTASFGLSQRAIQGMSLRQRALLLAYIREMGASIDLLGVLGKTDSKNLYWIPTADRERLGLVSGDLPNLTTHSLNGLIGPDACKATPLAITNCITLKQEEPQKTAAP